MGKVKRKDNALSIVRWHPASRLPHPMKSWSAGPPSLQEVLVRSRTVALSWLTIPSNDDLVGVGVGVAERMTLRNGRALNLAIPEAITERRAIE